MIIFGVSVIKPFSSQVIGNLVLVGSNEGNSMLCYSLEGGGVVEGSRSFCGFFSHEKSSIFYIYIGPCWFSVNTSQSLRWKNQ